MQRRQDVEDQWTVSSTGWKYRITTIYLDARTYRMHKTNSPTTDWHMPVERVVSSELGNDCQIWLEQTHVDGITDEENVIIVFPSVCCAIPLGDYHHRAEKYMRVQCTRTTTHRQKKWERESKRAQASIQRELCAFSNRSIKNSHLGMRYGERRMANAFVVKYGAVVGVSRVVFWKLLWCLFIHVFFLHVSVRIGWHWWIKAKLIIRPLHNVSTAED